MTTKYTFSSIIKPFHYSRTYFKYNGTSLNRKKAEKRTSPISTIDIRRVEAQKAQDDFISDTGEYQDFPRVKVFKDNNKIGGRFKAPLLVPVYQPFSEAKKLNYVVDEQTGELTLATINDLGKTIYSYDYKEQTQSEIEAQSKGLDTSRYAGMVSPTNGEITRDTNGNIQVCVSNTEAPRSYSMSSRTRSKIKQKITAWYYARKHHKLTFVTLTFINSVDDRKAVKCLNNFLTWVRKNKSGFQYLWVAERQQNGRIHFHIICNKFLPVAYYNAYWVRCQNNLGISHSNGSNLNPFDITAIKQLKTLTKYVTKYITKNTTSFDCALWNCSRTISALSTGYTSDNTLHDYISANMPTYRGANGVYPCLGEVQTTGYATMIPIYYKKICESYKDVHAFNFKVLSTTDLSSLKELAETLYNRPARPISNTIDHALISDKLFEDLPRT